MKINLSESIDRYVRKLDEEESVKCQYIYSREYAKLIKLKGKGNKSIGVTYYVAPIDKIQGIFLSEVAISKRR